MMKLFFSLVLVYCLCSCRQAESGGKGGASGEALRLYCGAGLRPAMEDLIAAFAEETGIVVEPDYAGSGIILARAREDDGADLFLPGDVHYVNELQRLSQKVAQQAEISFFVPCIVVASGNPKKIISLADLFREDVRVAFGKSDACQIGRLTKKLLAKNGLDSAAIRAKESLTVNELGVWVKMNDVDAAIVWDATAANLGDSVTVVPIPLEQNIVSRVAMAKLTTARQPEKAQRFLEFCQSETAKRILRGRGFRVEAP